MTIQNQAPMTNTHRRGSAILIVIGTLAFIAVFAAIYISIGQGDQRVARSIESREEVVSNSNLIADHILGVIGDDRLDYTTQRSDNGVGIFSTREVTDAPYTDWTMLSESTDGWNKFNPSGRHSSLGTQPGIAQDFRVASDPWLASTSPTYLGNPGHPLASDDRPFGSLITDGAVGGINFIGETYSSGFLDNRDWLQISNLAPDGRFVNLFNLRQNEAFSDGTIGGFNAEPGTGLTNINGRDVRRMSQYLSLWNQELPGDPESRIKTLVPTNGIWLPGRTDPATNHGLADITNTPAVWSMYQRFMFLPLNQPFLTVNRNNQISTWADPDFAAYQYADADGDGMADSRWIELTSAQDTQSGSNSPRTDIERLYDSGRNRIFAAIRVMDLSSAVNVNTAMDQLTAPNPAEGGQLGATPADVDLRRLLSMSDVGYNYSILQLAGLSPSNFHKPTLTTNNDLLDADYKWYRNYIDPAAGTTKTIEPSTNAMSVGRFAYNAIKLGIEHGGTLDDRYYAWPPVVREQNDGSPLAAPAPGDFDDGFNPEDGDFNIGSPFRLDQFHQDPLNLDGEPMTNLERSEWYRNIGRLDPFAVNQVTGLQQDTAGQPYEVAGALYNQDDLFELLAFHGLNDPASISRLEKAAMGRMPSIFGQNQRAFSPLLSNRPLSLDRYRHGFNDESTYAIAAAGEPRRINGKIAKESMAFFAVTPRRLLTTVSGGAHILPGSIVDPNFSSLDEIIEAPPVLDEALKSPTSLFNIYSKALVGELDSTKLAPANIDDTYILDPELARGQQTATLFYGHRGPELALRIAAHTAVNMADLYDADSEPSAATVILDDSVRDDLVTNYDGENSNDPEYLHYAGRAQNNIFDPGEINTPDNKFTGDQDGRKAVNVFGIEPMPFLTEVSSMYVYTDSEDGDPDFGTTGIPLPPRPGFPGPVIPLDSDVRPVTINGDVTEANPDLMMQLIAFQLTNPWDVDITLGGTDAAGDPMGYIDDNPSANNTNLKFDYYIEFGGRFFKLGEYLEYNPPITPVDNRNIFDPAEYPDNPPPVDAALTSADEEYQYRSTTIPAHSARVFYAIAHARFDGEDGSSDLDQKWVNELGTFTDNDGASWTGPAEEWINRQLRVRNGGSAIHIHQFDPKTGELVEENGFNDLLASPSAADAVYANGTRAHDFQQARLWRKIAGNLEESVQQNLQLGSIRDNRIQNDLLVDRLTLTGADDSFDRKLAPGDNEIEGSAGYDINIYTQAAAIAIGSRNDNFGLTIARWATIRRGDQNDSDRTHDSGQIGAWMLSSHRDQSFNTIFSIDHTELLDTLTVEHFYDGSLQTLDRPYPLAEDLPNYEAHSEFARLDNLNLFEEIVHSLARNPRNKYRIGTTVPAPVGSEHLSTLFPELPIDANAHGDILHAVDSPLRPELLPNANEFNGAPRLADLLLAWGIGPTYTPDPTRAATNIEFDAEEARRWITLSEALAIGLGYQTDLITYSSSEPDADNIWIDTTTTNETLLDNGHLAIDNYVAYYNNNTASETTAPDFPDFDVADDIRRGTGVPMALGVIDQARPIESYDEESDQLSAPTYGLININTAPIEVLRLLPGLSPSLAQYYPVNNDPATASEWWNDTGDLNLPDLSAPDQTPDVAASMVGYRDRTFIQPRFRSADIETIQFTNPLNYSTADQLDNNALDNTPSHASNLVNEITELDPTNTQDHRDRQTIAGIDGLRQTPGFGSLGEVLAVTIGSDAMGAGLNGSGPVALQGLHPQLSIQQFAYDDLKLDGPGDNIVALDPQLYSGRTNGATVDDYAERLALASGILNTISVRSDYYAVWFIIHAYQESDVTNLQPEDPLIPSLAKRYVMVVDRTNVINPGDTPKVVFIREVPM